MGPRASQDLRSPSSIMAPGSDNVCQKLHTYLMIFNHLRTYSQSTQRVPSITREHF